MAESTNTPNRYRELAAKWMNISEGIEQGNWERKELLEDKIKRVEERVGKGDKGATGNAMDPRFKVPTSC